MARRRRGLTMLQRAELWARWKDGQSLSEIAWALNQRPSSIYAVVVSGGGFPPDPRKRSDRALALSEREEISRGLCAGLSFRAMAERVGRAPSTVSREVKANGGKGAYRAAAADTQAWTQALRPKKTKLQQDAWLCRLVAKKLSLDWSPEQIAGWLRREFPDQGEKHVSHETIYRSLFIQARGVLKKELIGHLRSNRKARRSSKASTAGQKRGQIVDAVSIRERPAEVEDRAVPGHWEGDLISGSHNSHIATLVERQSRFTMLVKVEGKDTASVVSALSKQVRTLPAELRKSLTWDRGLEMASHRNFTLATKIKVFFCDPQSPWQRGTNENTNRLLRQYFPKGTSLAGFSQRELNQVALRLNQRPRKTLAFDTPASMLQQIVAATG